MSPVDGGLAEPAASMPAEYYATLATVQVAAACVFVDADWRVLRGGEA